MRKSSLILLLAMAFVLTTVVSGFCVVNEIGEPCVTCTDKEDGWKYGLEIEMVGCDPTAQDAEACPCPTFDYELGSVDNGGYCDIQDVKGVLFKLCDCEKIAEMSTASSYALRLTIMEPASGVYWTDQNTMRSDQGTCSYTDITCTEGTTGSVYVSTHEDPSLEGNSYCVDPCDATDSQYAMDYYSVTAGQELYSPATMGDEDCCFTCGTNRVKAVQTCYGQILSNLESLMLIDLPTLVYDPNDINVQIGTAVKVKVELVEMPDDNDICAGACKSICECIVKIGEFANCTVTDCQLCLPYLPAADSGWWAGVAFTNNAASATEVTVNFYAGGTSASYTLTVAAKSVETIVLSAILDDLAGLATDAPIYASVTSDGSYLNGYVMMGNGSEAQGYLAVAGACGCGACCD